MRVTFNLCPMRHGGNGKVQTGKMDSEFGLTLKVRQVLTEKSLDGSYTE